MKHKLVSQTLPSYSLVMGLRTVATMEVSRAIRKTGKLNPKRMKATADEDSDGSSKGSVVSAGCLISPSILSSRVVSVRDPGLDMVKALLSGLFCNMTHKFPPGDCQAGLERRKIVQVLMLKLSRNSRTCPQLRSTTA